MLYSRMKNLVYDDIPKLEWELKYDIPKKYPRHKIMEFEPEKLKNLKKDLVPRDNINQWVEDSIFSTILRKKYDKFNEDKNLLFVYRMLAIQYRVRFPVKGEPLELDSDIKEVLERKICNGGLV